MEDLRRQVHELSRALISLSESTTNLAKHTEQAVKAVRMDIRKLHLRTTDMQREIIKNQVAENDKC